MISKRNKKSTTLSTIYVFNGYKMGQIRNYLASRIRIHNLELRIQGSRSEAMSSICQSGTLIWAVLSNVQYMLNTVNRYCNIFHNLSRRAFLAHGICTRLSDMHWWLVLFDTLVSYIPHRKTRCEFLSAFKEFFGLRQNSLNLVLCVQYPCKQSIKFVELNFIITSSHD